MLYYYPNRPALLPPDPKKPLKPTHHFISSLEKTGIYIAEQKWNGDNILIDTTSLKIWNRHKEIHRYNPTPQVKEELRAFPKGCWINAELIHYRTKTIKNMILVHCIYVYKNKPLIGKTWGDSRDILKDLSYGEHVVLSPVWKTGFWKLFKDADGEIIEGIILKDPTGQLVISCTVPREVTWMKKIRKPSKKYCF